MKAKIYKTIIYFCFASVCIIFSPVKGRTQTSGKDEESCNIMSSIIYSLYRYLCGTKIKEHFQFWMII